MPDNLGPGDHVMVTVDPARNGGAASLSRRMVPFHAVLGLLLAGEPIAAVRYEHDLTEAEGHVVAALAAVVRDLSRPEVDQDYLPAALAAVEAFARQVADGHRMAVDDYAHMPDVAEEQRKQERAFTAAARLVSALVPTPTTPERTPDA